MNSVCPLRKVFKLPLTSSKSNSVTSNDSSHSLFSENWSPNIDKEKYDKNLNRIGYGGGFYDRYIKKIKKNKKIITIGLAYSFQKVKKIPVNEYDIKLDFIVTEKKN